MRIGSGLRPVTLVFAVLLFSPMMTLPIVAQQRQARPAGPPQPTPRRADGTVNLGSTEPNKGFFSGRQHWGYEEVKRSEGRNSLSTVGKGIERISSGHSVQIRSRRILPPTGRAAGDDNAVSLPVHSTAGGEAHSDHIRRRHTHLAQHLYGWKAASRSRQAQSDLDRPLIQEHIHGHGRSPSTSLGIRTARSWNIF